MSRKSRSLERNFEGEAILSTLLKDAKCPLVVADIIEEFQAGVEEGSEPSDIIPLLWEGEPRFSSPDQARRTFANLFGLWDEIHKAQLGDLITLLPPAEVERPLTPKYTEFLWKQFEELTDKDFRRTQSRFENTSDGLNQYLAARMDTLSPKAVEVSFQLAFECWWILDTVESANITLPTYDQLLETEAWFDDGNIDQEPALGQLVKTALWEEAADEDPIPEAEIPLVEGALRVIRNATLNY